MVISAKTKASIDAFFGAGFLAMGIDDLLSNFSVSNSIREAVYAHADKITPEIIEQANKLASKEVGLVDHFLPAILFGAAGYNLYKLYQGIRKQDQTVI